MLIGRSFRDSARFATLIALALLMKALVPAGWMPVFEDGTVTLRLCGGWAPALAEQPAAQQHHDMAMSHDAVAPSSNHDEHEQEQQSSNKPCTFAAAGLSWTSPNFDPATKPLLPSNALVTRPSTTVAVGRGLAAPLPPSTGPPLLT